MWLYPTPFAPLPSQNPGLLPSGGFDIYVDININTLMSNLSQNYLQTLAVRDRCLCLAVHRAARTLARYFDEVFRPLGITHGQFSLLNGLNRPEPPTMGEIAQLLAMDRTTLTAALKPLVARELVTISRDKKDRRQRRLILNPAGLEVLKSAWPLWEQAHNTLEAERLPGADIAILRDNLTHIAA